MSPRLLIIDDEPNLRYSLAQSLRSESLEILTAASAAQGIDLVRSEHPDAALLDVRLPDMSGLDAFDRIRQIDPPPVIVSVVNWADCLVAMQQREIDAVSTDDSILAGLVEEDPYLHIIGPNMATQPYGIGIKLDNTALVRFVNGTLERIRRDGTWNTLYRKWLTVLGPAPTPPTPRYVD